MEVKGGVVVKFHGFLHYTLDKILQPTSQIIPAIIPSLHAKYF